MRVRSVFSGERGSASFLPAFVLLISGVCSLPAWPGSDVLGNELTGQVTGAGGGGVSGYNGYSLNGTVGQPVVGYSLRAGEAELFHGVHGPRAGAPLEVQVVGDANVSKSPGESHTFQVLAQGGQGPLAYQWRKETSPGVFEAIPGANSASYTIDLLTIEDSGVYNCEVSDAVLSIVSGDITLVVDTGLPATQPLLLAVLALLLALWTAGLFRGALYRTRS